jgi:hypothetical protein
MILRVSDTAHRALWDDPWGLVIMAVAGLIEWFVYRMTDSMGPCFLESLHGLHGKYERHC